MFGFLRRPGGLTKQDRADLQEYLRTARLKMDQLEKEFEAWMQVAAKGGQLGLEGDPDGQHAAVYVWRVTDAARDFVQESPPKIAQEYYEAFSDCLEARADAADALKEAADRATVVDPARKLVDANQKLAEAERQRDRARDALDDLEEKLARA